ncbi:MAG: hypothetical protein AAF250_10585 [Pseudomonadota bacterium]
MQTQTGLKANYTRHAQLPDVVLGKPKFAKQRFPYAAMDIVKKRQVDIVHMSDDPFHWRALMARATRGDRPAFRELLIEFNYCLEMFFDRIMPPKAAAQAIDDTLEAAAAKLATCDTRSSILSWLLEIAKYQAANPSEERAY